MARVSWVAMSEDSGDLDVPYLTMMMESLGIVEHSHVWEELRCLELRSPDVAPLASCPTSSFVSSEHATILGGGIEQRLPQDSLELEAALPPGLPRVYIGRRRANAHRAPHAHVRDWARFAACMAQVWLTLDIIGSAVTAHACEEACHLPRIGLRGGAGQALAAASECVSALPVGSLPGFKNQGNTCFAASMMQVWLSLDNIVSVVTSHEPGEACLRPCVLCCLKRCEASARSPTQAADIATLQPLLQAWGMTWGVQHDAAEFCCQLFHGLDDAKMRHVMASFCGWTERRRYFLPCDVCGHFTHLREHDQFVWVRTVPVARGALSVRLQSLLAAADEPGRVGRQAPCSSCGATVEEASGLQWEGGADVLMLELRRAVEKEGRQVKCFRSVRIPAVVCLGACLYQVAGVVEHVGRDPSGGHYIAWVKTDDGYLRYNDDQVEVRASLADSVHSNATFLTLRRHTARIATLVDGVLRPNASDVHIVADVAAPLVGDGACVSALSSAVAATMEAAAPSHVAGVTLETQAPPDDPAATVVDGTSSGLLTSGAAPSAGRHPSMGKDIPACAADDVPAGVRSARCSAEDYFMGEAYCTDAAPASPSDSDGEAPQPWVDVASGALLPELDGHLEFEAAVGAVLKAYELGGASAATEALSGLPAFSREIRDASWSSMRARLRTCVDLFEVDSLGVEDAVRTTSPLWRTTFFPLAVLMEAWSRATGIPSVFYVDAFTALWTSLLHKEVGVLVAGFTSRARYWACGTAGPGSGKTPALEPLKDALLEVMQAHADLAPGLASDRFHLQQAGTHAAAVDKLRETSGFEIIASAEGGPMLCPTWPTASSWNQATHVNFQRFLDAATGGPVPWETVIDRKARKHSREEEVAPDTQVPSETTNVGILIFQQLSVFTSWWAAAESKMQIGLPGRFVFSFGGAHEPGPPRLAQFGHSVVIPLVKKFFQAVLERLGPNAPISEASPCWRWSFDEAGQDSVHRFRVACHDLASSTRFGETFSSGLNKAAYWLSQVSLQTSILQLMWPGILGARAEAGLSEGTLTRQALKLAMCFFNERFLLGSAVLDVEIRKQARVRRKLPRSSRQAPGDLAAQLLRTCVGATVGSEIAGRAGLPFRDLRATDGKRHASGLAALRGSISFMVARGLGVLRAGDAFDKLHFSALSEGARKFLKEHGVPLWTFGGHISYRHHSAGHLGGLGVVSDDTCGASKESVDNLAPPLAAPGRPGSPGHMREGQRGPEAVEPFKADTARHGPPAQSPPQRIADGGRRDGTGEGQVAGIQWRVLFDGAPPMPVGDSVMFYAVVRNILGKFPEGAGHIILKGQPRQGFPVVTGACPPTCEGCTFKLRAKKLLDPRGQVTICVEVSGEHGYRRSAGGGSLWTLQQLNAIHAAFPGLMTLTTAGVRAALHRQELPIVATARQLQQWVTRENRKRQPVPVRSHIVVQELVDVVKQWQANQAKTLAEAPIDELMIVGQPLVTPSSVCLAWTCPGFLQCLQDLGNRAISLVVDAKQRVVHNQYSIVTLAILAKRQATATTTAARLGGRQRVQIRAQTATAQPLLQALVEGESASNLVSLFKLLCDLTESQCGVKLRGRVLQVHKDFALGIEAARKEVFPTSRSCNDFPHLMRAARPKLLMHAKDSNTAHWLLNLLVETRFLPTLELFDAVWHIAFHRLRAMGEEDAEKYLRQTFFLRPAQTNVSKLFAIKATSWGCGRLLFAGHWCGVLGTRPGSATGSQTIEAFHSFWQKSIQASTRRRVVDVLDTMQGLFRGEWRQHFGLGNTVKLGLWPRVPDSTLLNGSALRSVGRSTAAEYWVKRGLPNFWECTRSGTTFVVMQGKRVGDVYGADAVARESIAKILVRLLMGGGATLEQALADSAISEGQVGSPTWTVSHEHLAGLFGAHAVVMHGDLPARYWPAFYRSGEEAARYLCTCPAFGQRAECEHVYFAQALHGGLSLEGLPLEKPKGRPPKRPPPKGEATSAKRLRRK